MSVADIIGLITNIVTSLTAVAAVLYVIKQTRQIDDTLRSQVYQGLIDNSLKIDELLLDHPEFRRYFYGDEPLDASTPDLDRILSAMEFVTDIADNVLTQQRFIPKSEVDGWRAFADQVLTTRAAQYFLKEHGTWYSGKIPETVTAKTSPRRKALGFLARIPRIRSRERIEYRKRTKGKRGKRLLRQEKRGTANISSHTLANVMVAESPIHGLGMFATDTISGGEVVVVQGGSIVQQRELHLGSMVSGYLPIDDRFSLGGVGVQDGVGTKLYLNHSCSPNCGIRGEVTFIALHDILKGEELTFDYATVYNEDYEFQCDCGSANCRKIIRGRDWKDQSLQDKRWPYFSRYLSDKIVALRNSLHPSVPRPDLTRYPPDTLLEEVG